MNVEVMKELLKVVQNVSLDNLDMSVWKSDCGTIGCLAGNAASTQYFIDKGLTIVDDWFFGEPTKMPGYDGKNGYEALAKFFELHIDSVSWLFDPSYYLYNSGHLCKAEVEFKIKLLLESEGVVVE